MMEIERNNDYITFEDREGDYKSIYTMVKLDGSKWFLMFQDFYNKNDKKLFHVESLVSENGEYVRFIVQSKDFERVVVTNGKYVVSDSMFVGPSNDDIYGLCNVYNSMTLNAQPLNDYLVDEPIFEDINGNRFETKVPTSKIIQRYILKNQVLRKQINDNKQLSISK